MCSCVAGLGGDELPEPAAHQRVQHAGQLLQVSQVSRLNEVLRPAYPLSATNNITLKSI